MASIQEAIPWSHQMHVLRLIRNIGGSIVAHKRRKDPQRNQIWDSCKTILLLYLLKLEWLGQLSGAFKLLLPELYCSLLLMIENLHDFLHRNIPLP